jgi:two-component system cell cycle response regulator
MDKILIVEDDLFFKEMYAGLLQAEGYLTDTASCGSEAFDLMSQNKYELVITDLVMPDISGMDILARVKETDPGIDVILVT